MLPVSHLNPVKEPKEQSCLTAQPGAHVDHAHIYGHKAAQLMDLEQLTREWGDLLVDVKVPPFEAISSQDIQRHIGSWLSEDWDAFCRAQGDRRELTEEAKEILARIRQNIHTRFEEEVFRLPKRPEGALMVRSSGAEDRKDLDNAGGNTTECNVIGEDAVVSQAIGTVVASYFGENSLIQRLLAGDNILHFPTMGVIVQTMIGCTDDPLRIVSGVGYREEPLARTKHTSAIHAAPGHGEFVVTGEGVVDDYYVTRHEGIEPIVRRKPFRIAPKAEGGILATPNDPQVATGSSVPTEHLITLHRIMGHLQDLHAGAGIDIEFVLDKGAGEIPPCLYLVQARPRVQERRALQPQYAICGAQVEKHSGTCTIGGTLEVLKDIKEEEVIRSRTLSDAFEQYKHMPQEQREKVRCVLTEYPGRRMSHEGCHFHRLRIPVVSMGSCYQSIPAPFHLETVSGTIYCGEDIEIKEGLKESPIPKERSLHAATKHIPGPPKTLDREEATTKELLERIKTATDTKAIDLLEARLIRFFTASLKDSGSCRPLAHNIFREIARVRYAILHYPPQSPERLLPIKFLEALLFQDKEASIKHLLASKKHRTAVCTKYGANPDAQEEYFLLMHMANMCLTRNGKENWHSFVTAVLQDPKRGAQLQEMMLVLQDLDLIMEWINYCFGKREKIEDPVAYFDTLWAQYETIKPYFSFLEWSKNFIDYFKIRMEQFSNPDLFETKSCQELWNQLHGTIYNITAALSEIASKYPISEEEQCIGSALFRQLFALIEVCDQSIKTLTSTPETIYPTALKVKRFKIMLEYMIRSLLIITDTVPIHVIANIQGQQTQHADPQFLKKMMDWFVMQYEQVCNSEEDIEQLSIRPEFNVQEVRLPSMDCFSNKPRQNFRRHNFTTLEEIFTTTHGYMKDLTSAWQRVSTCNKSIYTPPLHECLPLGEPLLPQTILYPEARQKGDRKATPSSYSGDLTMRNHHIEQSIFLPGQAHEGSFRSSVDVRTQNITYQIKMVGDTGYSRGGRDRWKNVLLYAALGGKLLGLEEIDPPFVRRLGAGFSEFLATWGCNPKTQTRDPSVFRTQLEELLSLVTTATMPDAIAPTSKLHKFQWGDNNNVAQVLHNLSIVFGKEAVRSLVENLEPAFYLKSCGCAISREEMMQALSCI